MSIVQENYGYKRMTASGALVAGPAQLGGFFCTAAGTLEVAENNGGAAGNVVIGSFAVAIGVFYSFPFAGASGFYATLGGGAQGTFAINT